MAFWQIIIFFLINCSVLTVLTSSSTRHSGMPMPLLLSVCSCSLNDMPLPFLYERMFIGGSVLITSVWLWKLIGSVTVCCQFDWGSWVCSSSWHLALVSRIWIQQLQWSLQIFSYQEAPLGNSLHLDACLSACRQQHLVWSCPPGRIPVLPLRSFSTVII